MTIAHSQCEHATDYADIETLICRLPIDQCTFAAHGSLAPYSGPYPMTTQVRACLLKELNGWDETSLHDCLHANPSLCRELGFETLPNQSTLWWAGSHRFSAALCEGVRECAATIVRAARRCDVSLPDRIEPNQENDSHTDDQPDHQLITEKTNDIWQQAKPFVCDAFTLKRGQTGRFMRTRSGNNTPTWKCARTCMPRAAQPRLSSTQRESALEERVGPR